MSSASVARSQPPRPVIFLDIDGVLNTTKHNAQIHFEPRLLKRLKGIVEMTDALIVLSTFWRHFHEYITYVLHRHGIDVGRHMLPLPMGATRGKQCTKKFLHFHCIKQKEHGHSTLDNDESSTSMIGRSADDEGEYASRGEEIEAWLKTYGDQYLGDCKVDDSNTDDVAMSGNEEYAFHQSDWRYVILDDRPTAAKPDTPLFDRFIFVDTEVGLTKEDAETAIKLLRFGT